MECDETSPERDARIKRALDAARRSVHFTPGMIETLRNVKRLESTGLRDDVRDRG